MIPLQKLLNLVSVIVCRGAHTFFLRTGDVPRWGGYTVNLIHYEDAALLSAAVHRLPLP